MKNKLSIIILSAVLASSCAHFLDVTPTDRFSGEELFKDPNAVRANMATLYNLMPIEDFNYNPAGGFNLRDEGNTPLGFSTSFYTDESMNSAGTIFMPNLSSVSGYWAYSAVREVNIFMDVLKDIDLPQDLKDKYMSEAHFVRAYMYFGMAKRYGGVPLIEKALQVTDDLNIPRATEKETWDFVLSECDKAIAHLPESWNTVDGQNRATVWAAYALKSRAALFAASVAKYWNRANLVGEAVDLKLVGGMTAADAEDYYKQCIEASWAIIENSGKALYEPEPASVADATVNYQTIFETPEKAACEVIFSKAFVDGTTNKTQGHSTDCFFSPSQGGTGYRYSGRFSPVLDLVDVYEDYTDDGTGRSAVLSTRVDGVENEYVANLQSYTPSPGVYKTYETLEEIFKGKDARFHASILYPGSEWKGHKIMIQGGLITKEGNLRVYVEDSAEGKDGKTYYTYGAETPDKYSGFKGLGMTDVTQTNYSCTGFTLRKFLQEAKTPQPAYLSSTQSFIDMRLAEIYLNYAEAAVESDHGDETLAKQYLNALRKRAAHSDEIPLTLENVLRERRVELAFEGHRYWDLVRRREYHSEFNQRIRKSLVPVIDLREDNPKYVFIRANNYYDNQTGGMQFYKHFYYLQIPGTASNHLVMNPIN